MASHRALALTIAAFALAGMLALLRYLFLAITRGFTPGRLGAIHYAGSMSYAVGVFGMIVGLALAAGLLWMCWKWLRPPDPG